MTYQAPDATNATLRLHYNENTAGCSPAVLDALRRLTVHDIAIYPEYGAGTARCAEYLGVDARWIQLTNGLDEGIQVTTSWVQRHAPAGGPAEIIVVEPAFEMYAEFAEMVGGRLRRLAPEEDFRFPLSTMLATIGPSTRAIYLTDPNNPTGLGIPAGAVEAIAAAAPQALVFVDEAYSDFSGRTLIGGTLDRWRNVVVGRTFAKGHGLAGLRIGALVAHPETLDQLRSLLPPFNVNVCALHGLNAALGDREHLARYVAEVSRSRELVYAFCRRHALAYWPSEANFVLFRLGERTASVVAALRERGMTLRDKSAAPGCEGCIRLTAGVVAHTEAALAAMEDVLASRPD